MTRFGTWSPDTPLSDTPRAVALGVFDGLHIGHRAVIRAACGVRHEQTPSPFLTACVLSLTGVPKTGAQLTHAAEKQELCGTLGVDEWLELPFSEVRDMSPETFVREILHKRLQARVLCCGYNYRFGKGGNGDTALLSRLCEPLGIRVIAVPAVTIDGEPVSATRIRGALERGDMPAVMRLLGRPFSVRQPVTRGNRVGHTWGFPTINQVFPCTAALPRFGVYASLAFVDGKRYFAVTNVGIHPTVGGAAQPQAETWIADFDGDLYGTAPKIELLRFLREERRFSSSEELKTCIALDRKNALSCLSGDKQGGIRAVLFDFDDTLQHRPTAFFAAAKELLHHHFPHLTEAELDHRTQVMLEENAGGYVHYPTYFRRLLERWQWDTDSPEALFEEYMRCFPSHTALFADSADTLRELRKRGYLVGIITNGSRFMQNRKLDISGLRPLLDIAVVSGDERIHKPDKELFLRTAARLCLAPEQCLYVGDHPVNDIQGALSAGMKAVFIRAGQFSSPEADVPVINTPHELLEML